MNRRILVIAPHADDETLGMGATIAKRVAAGDTVTVAIMTGHGGGEHPLGGPELWDDIRREARAAMDVLGVTDLRFFELPAVLLSEVPLHVSNGTINALVRDVAPHELFLPFHNDMHRDHEILSRAGMVASRTYQASNAGLELVAMYETPTETHLVPAKVAAAFQPDWYEDVGDHIDAKLAAWDCYRSQHQAGHTPRSPDALRGLATVRGADIGCKAAEAFSLVRAIRR